MATNIKPRRLLLAVAAAEQEILNSYVRSEALPGWSVVQAESLGEARFKLQHTACDVLLLDESLCRAEDDEGWAWLMRQQHSGVIILVGGEAETYARAYAHGALICMPRAALGHLGLVTAALQRAGEYADLLCNQALLKQDLEESQHQLDELVNCLWQTFPTDPEKRWYTHRHTLERLEEEVERSVRHGCALTVVVGVAQGSKESGESLSAWTTEQVARRKRRCDVAGHYGPHWFLLLLPHTTRRGGWVCCRRLHQALESTTPPGAAGPVRAYFGIATLSAGKHTPQALLLEAEEHLALARAETGGRVVGGPDDPMAA
jgi:GGDEF domain-containing protein